MSFGWNELPYFAYVILALWSVAFIADVIASRRSSLALLRSAWISGVTGTSLLGLYIGLYWIAVERPPLRTLGETRLWYSMLLPLVGYLVEMRWGIRWLKPYCTAMAVLFLVINLLSPDSHDKTLMPALQSPWFIPHVIVYIVGYAVLGGSALVGAHGLYRSFYRQSGDWTPDAGRNLVTLGFVFISFGLIFGAFWAKEAWGHYWSWDPKETWALLTWLVYLVFIHVTWKRKISMKLESAFLVGSFVVLLLCWFGLNYMLAGQSSIHTYTG